MDTCAWWCWHAHVFAYTHVSACAWPSLDVNKPFNSSQLNYIGSKQTALFHISFLYYNFEIIFHVCQFVDNSQEQIIGPPKGTFELCIFLLSAPRIPLFVRPFITISSASWIYAYMHVSGSRIMHHACTQVVRRCMQYICIAASYIHCRYKDTCIMKSCIMDSCINGYLKGGVARTKHLSTFT